VKAAGTKTVTSALRGIMGADPRTREELLSLTRKPAY
jgi:GTP cyclohydrolase I